MTRAAELVVDRGLAGTVEAVRRLRRLAASVARRMRGRPAAEVLAAVRREVRRVEPDLARAIEGGVLAAWVGAALRPARELPRAERPGDAGPAIPPAPPGPPFGPLSLAPTGGDPERPVRWPAVEAAARDLLSRGAVTPQQFTSLAADARRTAFTLAGFTTSAAVDAVKEAVTHDVLHGGTLREFRDRLGAAFEAEGVTEHEAETVYRTQTGLARASGLRKVLDHPLVADEFPYVAWEATHDGRVRADHLAMERAGIQGTNVYRCDDPNLRRVWPPCGYNCRCVVRPLTLEDAAAKGVREAREWLRTGEPPAHPAYVDSVPVRLPKDWPVPDGGVRPVV